MSHQQGWGARALVAAVWPISGKMLAAGPFHLLCSRVTLANLLSPAVAAADGGKADGKREISEAVAIERSDPTVPLTSTPTGVGLLQCHLTPEPWPPCPFSHPFKHFLLFSGPRWRLWMASSWKRACPSSASRVGRGTRVTRGVHSMAKAEEHLCSR